MIKTFLRLFFLLVSITCIGYGCFSEIVSFAIAGSFVYILSVISSLVECIKESKIPVICIYDNRYDQGIKPILNYILILTISYINYN